MVSAGRVEKLRIGRTIGTAGGLADLDVGFAHAAREVQCNRERHRKSENLPRGLESHDSTCRLVQFLLAVHFVFTLSNSTSISAEGRVPRQFAGNTLALKILNGATAGVVSDAP